MGVVERIKNMDMKRNIRNFRGAAYLLMSLLLASCGGGGDVEATATATSSDSDGSAGRTTTELGHAEDFCPEGSFPIEITAPMVLVSDNGNSETLLVGDEVCLEPGEMFDSGKGNRCSVVNLDGEEKSVFGGCPVDISEAPFKRLDR